MNGNVNTCNDEKVSVIIPTFNRAKYIGEAIDSVLAQTYPVSEIIVIDDGSTDRTKDIVRKYGHPVKYVFQENRGPSSARNMGLRMAQGNYIAFIDSDDMWEPDKVEIQIDFFRKYPQVDFVFGHMANFSSSDSSHEPEILNKRVCRYFKENYRSPERALDYLMIENVIPTPTVMFKSNCLKTVGFFNENLFCTEDFDFWLRFVYHCRIGFIDRIFIRRRLHATNIINDYLLRFQSKLTVLEAFGRKYPDLPKSTKRELRRAIRKTNYRLGSYYFKLRDFDNSFRFLKRAFPHYLLNWKYDVKIAWSLLFRENE